MSRIRDSRRLWILLLAGCRSVVDLAPPGDPPPSIEGLLVAGTNETTFRLVWPLPTGATSSTPRPITPSEALLTLTDEGGLGAPLVARDDTVALYRVLLPIVAGHRYRLHGAVGDRTIEALTTVPLSFTIEEPTTDPIDAAEPIPFRWRATGASAFAADVAVFGRTGATHTKSTSGTLRVRPGHAALRLWAMNRDAEGYLLNLQMPQSNVTGGTGVLGGAILVERNLRWP